MLFHLQFSPHLGRWHKLLHGINVLRLQVQRHIGEVVSPLLDVLLSHIEDLDLVASLLLHGTEQLLLVLRNVSSINGRECFDVRG